MARLINESGVLGDSMEVTAETVKDVPFYKMIEAIDVTQERMGIMGTTAKEAAGTIQGSTGSMRAAWQNMLTGMADENADFTKLAENFIGTLITEDGQGGVLGTIIPRVSQVINGISEAITTGLPMIMEKIIPMIQAQLPIIVTALQNMLQSIFDLLPQIMPVIADLIPQIVTTLVSLLPQIVNVGIQLITSIINGIAKALPSLIQQMPKIIILLAKTLIKNLPKIIQAGVALIKAIITGIVRNIQSVGKTGAKIVTAVASAVRNGASKMLSVGLNLVKGIWSGISNGLGWIKGKIRGWVGNVTSFLKNLFGISSPSKLFRDEIGKNLALGIGVGFSDEMRSVADSMGNSIPTDFDINPSVSGARYIDQNTDMVGAFKEALGQVKIVLDDEVAGRFVDKTVTRIIYT